MERVDKLTDRDQVLLVNKIDGGVIYAFGFGEYNRSLYDGEYPGVILAGGTGVRVGRDAFPLTADEQRQMESAGLTIQYVNYWDYRGKALESLAEKIRKA